jgi:hypothetical protein
VIDEYHSLGTWAEKWTSVIEQELPSNVGKLVLKV